MADRDPDTIKAWQARTVNAGLENYFEGVGLPAISAFQREIENFFGNTVFRATPEFLALYGLDPSAMAPTTSPRSTTFWRWRRCPGWM